MTANTTLLDPPGVLSITGVDARKLLQGLITNDMNKLKAEGDAIHAALLTPQGKIMFAFFVVQAGDDFLIETSDSAAPDLAKRLTFYKLRAAVRIENVADRYGLAVAWSGAEPLASPPPLCVFRDPRHPLLGWRWLGPTAELPTTNSAASDYHAHRIAVGVPEPGLDYPLGDTYPHEADFDLFAGTDFDKGCYVGQEVVARMQHKTVVRKRVVRVSGGSRLATDHPDVLAGTAAIGRLGSVAGSQGLALLRLDRVAEALDKGDPLTAGGVAITVNPDDLTAYREAAAARTAAAS